MADHHKATQRVLEILELITYSGKNLSLSEIAEMIHAPKSSIFPMIHTLENKKYLEYNTELGKYSPGLSLYGLCSTLNTGKNLYRYVIEEMNHLVNQCGEASQLGILDGDEVLYIGKVDSPHPVRMASGVGTRLPANCVSLGKALLCDCTEEELCQIFSCQMKALTKNSITSISELYQQLQKIKEGEIAQEVEEVTEQIRCFALPLRKKGKIRAAIGITIPVFRTTDKKIEQITSLLKQSQQTIETMLNHTDGEIEPYVIQN